MAVTRIKAYHGTQSSILNPIDYITDEEKTDMIRHQDWFEGDGIILSGDAMQIGANAENAFDYATNPEKTTYKGDMGPMQELVSGYMCDPYMAAEQFQSTMDLYYQSHNEHLGLQTSKRIFRAKLNENNEPVLDKDGKMIYDEKAPVWHDADGKCMYESFEREMQPRTAYMWVLSFPPESVCGYKIDPRICHQIGKEFIKEIGGGQHQAVIATHMDREHPHDHIVMCAYAKDGSHKYRDTLDSLMYARQICDDLSRKFGLPVLPSISQEQGRAVNWAEWKSRQEGESWKEQMKQDIRGAVRIAKNYDQFLEIMKDSGYGIRETEKHITYIMPGEDEYRCRDKRLGHEFEKMAIMKHFEELQESRTMAADMAQEAARQEIDDPAQRKSHKPIHIFVSRYTLSGRRRSDLEMIFLVAIKIIRALKDRFRDMDASKAQPMNPVHRDWAWKERQMIDSMKMAQGLGLENKQQLDDLVKETGTKLSILKKEVKDLELDASFSEKVASLLDDIDTYRNRLSGSGFDEENLFLTAPDEKQVRENMATENPATPSQRRELYIQLQKYLDIYKLSCKYNELNAREAQQVIDFLQGKSAKKPPVLLDGIDKKTKELTDKYEYILKKRLEGEKEKYSEPATEAQKKRVVEILEGTAKDARQDRLRELEGREIDTDSLSKFDAMQIINYFAGKTTLTGKPADIMSRDKIMMMLETDQDKTLSLSRPAETLTLADVREVEEYLRLIPDRRKYAAKPSVLKQYEAPTDSYVEQVKELLQIRGIELTVPIEALSKSEIYDLTNYLLKLDAVPECLKSEEDQSGLQNDTKFEQRLLDYDEKTQQIILQLRDTEQQLMDLGISPDDYDKEKKIVRGDIDYLNGRLEEIEVLKREYKNLQRLKYNYGLATSEVFTRGGRFGKQAEKLEVEEQTENTKRSDEDKRQDEDIEKQEQKKYKASDPRVFSFTDVYFDQTHPL